MQFTALQIATLINGQLEGNPDAKVGTVSGIEKAEEGALSFLANPKYEDFLYTTNASVVIVNEGLQLRQTVPAALIRVKDAYAAFTLLLEKYNEIIASFRASKIGVEQPSFISGSAKVGKDAYIGAFSYIGTNATIGDNVKIYPGVFVGDNAVVGNNTILYAGVKVYDGCIVGTNVIIHSGVVIGGDGFGFAPQPDGSYRKIPQLGNVVIEDDVEIGANTTIDRATMGSTIVKNGTKLDNLIQIAHNAVIGSNNVIAAQTGISGSVKIGNNCMIGGQVGMVGHIEIANGTKINAKSGISKSVTEENTVLGGAPAFDYKSSLKSQAIFRNLPELSSRVAQLEEQLKALTQLLNKSETPTGG